MTPEEYIKAYTRGCSNELVHGGYLEWLTPENALAAVELARDEMREQMMKDAIEVPVTATGIRANSKGVITYADIEIPTKERLNPRRDKVKVIIIKE